MNPPENHNQQIPKPKLEPTANPKAVAFLAFFPLTGVFGVHDAILGKPILGIVHTLITVFSPYVISLLFMLLMFISRNTNSDVNAAVSAILYTIIPLASYIWAIFEGIKYLKTRKNNNQTASQPQPAPVDNQAISQPNNHSKTAKKMLKIALILAGVALAWIMIVLSIGLPSLQGHDTGGGGAVLAVFVMPVIPLIYAVPILLIISLVQALLGARDKKKRSSQDNQQARP